MCNSKMILLIAGVLAFMAPTPSRGGQNDAHQKTETGKSSTAPPETSKNTSPDGSKAAADKDSKSAPALAWQILTDAAASEKLRDRSDAISALTILPRDAMAVGVITRALQDKEESIRALAATSLGDMKARPAIPQLKEALDDKSPQVSFAAAQALWKMGDRSGRDIFYDVLVGERKVNPGPIKGKIQKARLDMHDPKALALIGVNEASGAFLGPFSMGVSMVEEYAKHSGTSVQALCAQLLATDDTPYTVKELKLALLDSNWTVRAAAARSLAKLNVRSALPTLTDMMRNDKSQPARLAAAASVVALSARPAGPVTRRAPPDSAPSARPENERKSATTN